ncbi:MAG TPA: hypothetical protein VEJ36_01265, partial [Nitrososphaerales archaeon]|nr:hypothetical protein [Nitrososphaerales archaeon]
RTEDPLLKRQLKWFGLFALCFFVGSFTAGSFGYTAGGMFVQYAEYFACGFCLYRSAKSLIPIYSFSADKAEPAIEPSSTLVK